MKTRENGGLRASTELEQDVLQYLNILMESGATNMYGATPYISEQFDLSIAESMRMLSLWMKNFDSDGNYQEVIDELVTNKNQ